MKPLSLLFVGLSALVLPPRALSQPQTLLARAGAAWPAGRWSDSTLIVIDAQREYQTRLPLDGMDAATREIAELLSTARAAHTPIVHVLHVGRAGGLFDPKSAGFAVIDGLQPLPGETVVTKQLPNAFSNPNFEAELNRFGRKNLIVVGFMTHMCVSSTVRAALDHGYRCTVVAGACATRDLASGDATIIPARQVQDAELAALRDRFAVVVAFGRDLRP